MSINNKCAKCGCEDSYLTTPPPCPTAIGCPFEECAEIQYAQCIMYTGGDILCNEDLVVPTDTNMEAAITNIVDYFCLPPIPEITCNDDIVVAEDSSINEALEDIVSYFCLPPIPEILCGEDIVVTEDSSINEALEDIVSYFCSTPIPLLLCGADTVVQQDSSINQALEDIVNYFCDHITNTTANNGLTMSPTSNNVQLGGPLIQNTTITNSTFALNINSTTVPALALQRTSASGFTLDVNPAATTAQAISAKSTTTGFLSPVVDVVCQSGGLIGSQAIGAKGRNNLENSVSPISAVPAVYIETSTSSAAGPTNSIALRLGSTDNGSSRSGVSIEFGNTISAGNSNAYITNRIISRKTNNTSESSMSSTFIIQGKPTGIVDPEDQLTLQSTGQLLLNNYGTGTFTGIPAYNLSTTALGNVIETTAGLFGTAFRGYISPDSFPSLTFNKFNSNISLGTTVVFDTTNGVIQYEIENGVNVTSQYNQITGVWTCPQTGKYDLSYNVYLSSPANTYGWGEVGGTFTIGITDPTGAAIIYCADTFTAVQSFYYDKIYMTGGMQGVPISVGTQIVLKIQNLTGVAYTEQRTLGDNIDWAIRRVG